MKKINSFVFLSIILILLSGCKEEKSKVVYNVSKDDGQLLKNSQEIKGYEKQVENDPLNYNALVNLGNKYFDSGQHRKSIDTYKKALMINPGDANVRTDMGIMYRRLKDFDRAVKEFRRAAKDDPGHQQSRYNLGIVLFHDQKKMKEAAAAWSELLKINPNHERAVNIRNFINQINQSPQAGRYGSSSTTKQPQKKSDGWIK